MNRDDVKLAADALARLEALEAALASLDKVPHRAMPISFFDAGGSNDQVLDEVTCVETTRHQNDHGIKVFYPRDHYLAVIRDLIADEEIALGDLGVEP